MNPVDPTTPPDAPLNVKGLRLDGPTVEQWVKAGYNAENYPPRGYAVKPSKPMSKFYHGVGVNNSIQAGTLQINFSPYEHTGVWLGVYEAVDPAEIEALDLLVANKKSGVVAISEDEYKAKLKKKASASNSYVVSLATMTPTPGARQTVPSAEPIDTLPAAMPGEPVPVPLDSVADALKVVPIKKAK